MKQFFFALKKPVIRIEILRQINEVQDRYVNNCRHLTSIFGDKRWKNLGKRMPPISVNNAASAFGKSHTLNFFSILAQTKQVNWPLNHQISLLKVSPVRDWTFAGRTGLSFAKLGL